MQTPKEPTKYEGISYLSGNNDLHTQQTIVAFLFTRL